MTKALTLIAVALIGVASSYAQVGDSKTCPFYATLGYVSKDWVSGGHHVGFWGEPNRRLHGLQLGVGYMNLMPGTGLGFRTELNAEYYLSFSKPVRDMNWTEFAEYGLYVPFHLVGDVRLPNNYHIHPYGGIGFNWAIFGYYHDPWYVRLFDDKDYLDNYLYVEKYSQNQRPKRWNAQLELGCAFRYKNTMISVGYSWGLNKHQLATDDEYHQHKISANISLFFDELLVSQIKAGLPHKK